MRITSKFITQKAGFYHHKKVGIYSGSAQMAVFVENTTGRYGTIQNLLYRLEYDSPTLNWKSLKVRVRLYERDPATGTPGKDLLTESLIVDIPRSSFVWGRFVFNKS